MDSIHITSNQIESFHKEVTMSNSLIMRDIVIHYLGLMNTEEDLDSDYEVHQNSAKYLLNQTVRQLYLPTSKYYLTKMAKETWDKIRTKDDDIYNYWYRNSVEKNVEGEVEVKLYKGASKTPYDIKPIKKGDKFIFKDVFHDDHIIPMKLILKRLLALENPNRENVQTILDDITVCRMLKSEDRKIIRMHNRPYNEDEIIKTIYSEKDIILINYDYDK